MAKGRAKTANRAAYEKELRRIKRFMKSAEKRGFTFNWEAPPTPQRVTKQAIERLQQTRPAQLYEKASYVNPMTGEVMTGTEGRRFERSEAAKKGRRRSAPNFETLVQAFRQRMASYTPPITWRNQKREARKQVVDSLLERFDDYVLALGEDVIGRRLYEASDYINGLLDATLYDSNDDRATTNFVGILTVLNGGALLADEAEEILDEMMSF